MANASPVKVNVGVVGAGFGAAVLVPAFRSHAGCDVVALAASTQGKAATTAKFLNIPKAYGNWRDLVADPDVQAVAIAVPPVLQAEIALQALDLKKPVFCEKPLALDAAAAQRMAAAAQTAGVATMVDFEFLEDPVWKTASRWLAEGRLGQLREFLVNWQVETYAHRKGLDSWKTAPEGGTLNLFVSHTLYYLEKLAAPIARLQGHLHSPPGLAGAGDVNIAITAMLEGGALAVVSVGSASPHGCGHHLEFYGSEGALVLENPSRDYILGFEARAGTRDDKELKPLGPGPRSGDQWPNDGRIYPVALLSERFLAAIRQGTSCMPDLAAGLRVQMLMDAVRRSHQTGAWVETARA